MRNAEVEATHEPVLGARTARPRVAKPWFARTSRPRSNSAAGEPRLFHFRPRLAGQALTLLLLALLLAACSGSQRRADLIIINNNEPGSLDPANVVSLEDLRIA